MEVRMINEVSLGEAEDYIMALGSETTPHLIGEPGIGKTAMFERVVERTGFRGVYMDVPTLELGEIGIPMPNHQTKTTTLYPNEAWGFHLNEPMVIFLDEFTKPSSQAVMNTLHPLLNERRIANFKLHPDSIVITAGNNSSDGVGDNMKAHSLNRITVIPVRKPTYEEYIDYGATHGMAAEVMAWVKAYPHALAPYNDPTQADNAYIFNPKYPKRSFFSPRSGMRASHIIKKRDRISKNALMAALIGTIGESAARDMMAYIDVADALPTWEQIMADPKNAQVPTSPAALCIMAYGAIQRIERANIGKWFEYIKRTPTELQSVFCLSATKHPEKKQVLMTSAAFVDWMREHQYLF